MSVDGRTSQGKRAGDLPLFFSEIERSLSFRRRIADSVVKSGCGAT